MEIGEYRHVVRFQTMTKAPDGDGGMIETWADLAPPWHVSITPANVRDLERLAGSTIVAAATYVIRGRYRPDVTVKARVLFGARTFEIKGIANPQERGLGLVLFAVETV